MILDEIYGVEVIWLPDEHRLVFYSRKNIDEVASLYGWEKGCVYTYKMPNYKDRIWTNFYKDVFDFSHESNIRDWISTINKKAWDLLKKSQCHNLEILQYTSQYKEACDFAVHNPILLLLLIDYCVSNKLSGNNFREIVRERQKDILKKIGLVGSKSVAKLLRKVELQAIDEKSLSVLRAIFSDTEIIEKINHKKSINKDLIMLAEWSRWAIGAPVESVIVNNYSILKQIIDDSVRMGGNAAVDRLKKCTTSNGVRRVHDYFTQLDLEQRMLEDSKKKYRLFPPPPLPGDGCDIRPVTSKAELLRVAKHMGHCVASYTNRILDGKYYVYQFWGGEVATIGLYINENSVRLDQIQGKRNGRVSSGTRSFIYEWLDRNEVTGLL